MKKKIYNILVSIVSYLAKSKIEKYGKRAKLYSNFSIGIGALLSLGAIYLLFNSSNIILGIIGAVLLMLFALIFLGVGFVIKKIINTVPVDKLLREDYLKNVNLDDLKNVNLNDLKNLKNIKNIKDLKDFGDRK